MRINGLLAHHFNAGWAYAVDAHGKRYKGFGHSGYENIGSYTGRSFADVSDFLTRMRWQEK